MAVVLIPQVCGGRPKNFSPSSPSIRFGNRRRLKNSVGIGAAHIPAALIFNTAWCIVIEDESVVKVIRMWTHDE